MPSRIQSAGTFVFEGGGCIFHSVSGAAIDFGAVLKDPSHKELFTAILSAGVAGAFAENGLGEAFAEAAGQQQPAQPGEQNPFEMQLPKMAQSGIEAKLDELQKAFEDGYAKLAESYGLTDSKVLNPEKEDG